MILLVLLVAGYLGLAGFVLAGLLWASRKGDAVRIAPEPSDPPLDAALHSVPTRAAQPLRRDVATSRRLR